SYIWCYYYLGPPPPLHSFPTRRSSDLRADDQWADRRTGPFRARAADEDTGFRPGAPNTGILRFEYRATIKHQRASVIDDKTEIGCVCSDHSKRASEPHWHRVNE